MAGLRMWWTAAVVAGGLGGLTTAAYGLLNQQSRRARITIGEPVAPPFNADGTYWPDGSGPHAYGDGPTPLHFAVIGDSSAAGLGVDLPSQLPGVLLARGLAEESGRPVTLRTYAVCGATSRDLAEQVDAALADQPAVALVIIGANDVGEQLTVRRSANLLKTELARLRAADVSVVIGTCPDLGAILPIPQPLRSIARAWSLTLAKAQLAAVMRSGCVPVALADLLSPEFVARPQDLFSADRFHPNAAGYEAAVAILLAPLCMAIGLPDPTPDPTPNPVPEPAALTTPSATGALLQPRLATG